MNLILIATRHYHDFDPNTGVEYDLQDRLYRKGARSFVLMKAGEKPGDCDIAESYSLAGAFEWLRELPFQIKRNVISTSIAA